MTQSPYEFNRAAPPEEPLETTIHRLTPEQQDRLHKALMLVAPLMCYELDRILRQKAARSPWWVSLLGSCADFVWTYVLSLLPITMLVIGILIGMVLGRHT